MSDNPFHDAIQKPTPPTRQSTDHPHFYSHAHAQQREQKRLEQVAANMTRQELFDNGFLTVEELDDEELRLGRCRGRHGQFPPMTRRMESVPRDLYDAMVAEHQKRMQEQYRQNMDAALGTILEIMIDPSVEPKDRLTAAFHIKEQVMGKTPDKVAVTVDKAPWQELMTDVAQITRAQHLALKERVIDAEVVEAPDDSDVVHNGGPDVGISHDGSSTNATMANIHPPGLEDAATQVRSEGPDSAPGPDIQQEPAATVEDSGAHEFPLVPMQFQPAPPAPSFNNPANSSSTVVNQPLSQRIRQAQDEAERVAAARKARRDLIAAAKKRRIVERVMGIDVQKTLVGDAMQPLQDKLLSSLEGEPDAQV